MAARNPFGSLSTPTSSGNPLPDSATSRYATSRGSMPTLAASSCTATLPWSASAASRRMSAGSVTATPETLPPVHGGRAEGRRRRMTISVRVGGRAYPEQHWGFRMTTVTGLADELVELLFTADPLLPVARLVEDAIAHLDRFLAEPDADPLRRQPAPDDDFAAKREELLADVVRPAFAEYREVLAAEIAPHGRPADRCGVSWLPGGADIYARLARVHTSVERTPLELHETGLAIIDELAGEYRELGAKVFGTDDLAEIFRRLRTDPALRWSSGEELLDSARAAIARAAAEAPKWFGRIPDEPCQVEPVPEESAPSAPGAYYLPPAADGSRSGIYFANTYEATERLRHAAEATAFHEAIPGHHFQLSLAQGLTELPLLRRIGDFNAYIEGWGLYSERLAEEMGLYSDDAARLGMLTLHSLRAGRLVVDTGLHALGWSRQQAVDYLIENTPMPPLEIESEIDRY